MYKVFKICVLIAVCLLFTSSLKAFGDDTQTEEKVSPFQSFLDSLGTERQTAEERKAIELAKQCNMSDNVDIKLSAQKNILHTAQIDSSFFPIGWKATDVSASMYLVVFCYRAENKKKIWIFHVIPKDNIAQYIRGDMTEYLKNIKAVSTYTEEEVSDKIEKLLKPMIKEKELK